MKLLSVTLLSTLLFAEIGWTTTVVKMDLPALVQQADGIVHGRIEQTYGQWDPQLKTIFTYVSIQVDDSLKGNLRRSVLIRQLGGRVGAVNVSIAGMPRFAVGEEVLLFLESNPEGTYHVLGLAQGKYQVVNEFAVANFSGVDLVDNKTGQPARGPVVAREPLETFKSQIRGLLR